jgi:catechol 2,3-dioxygenase-like lactoylglutathione lyase family enzyme
LSLEFVSHFPEWDHTLFKVRDADLSIRFYSEYLGMAAVKDLRGPDGHRRVWMRFSENPHAPLFVFLEVSLEKAGAGAAVPLFSFRTSDLKTLEEVSTRAGKAGCLAVPAGDGGGPRGFFCVVSDPDGNQLEFFCPKIR